MKSIDHLYRAKGYSLIAGIDEAGRGPLAGPVFAAAVILPEHHGIEGIDDSKKLSPEVREYLFHEIREKALSFGIAWESNEEIDRTDILRATKSTMGKALRKLSLLPDFILIDAVNFSSPDIPQLAIIKGDERSESIAAASILAKVSRDMFMLKMHEKYPQYGFRENKGYGTREHEDALRKYGPCPIHRMSFSPMKTLSE